MNGERGCYSSTVPETALVRGQDLLLLVVYDMCAGLLVLVVMAKGRDLI